ncbi:MAG: type II toxin-antitoxin system VapC family toxin [Deltaproteobacteria bacterium]|nr:type II toxin-antitoxin system VapC family toxin [Deltaproteobacteria bacterium]
MMYVLDTNTVVYFLKGLGHVAERLLATPPGAVGLPAIVLFELEVGVRKTPAAKTRRRQLEELASALVVLPFDQPAAKAAAEVRVALERRGEPIGPFDTLIAGTALANSGVLVTHNTGEFGRVAGLRLEDWF